MNLLAKTKPRGLVVTLLSNVKAYLEDYIKAKPQKSSKISLTVVRQCYFHRSHICCETDERAAAPRMADACTCASQVTSSNIG